MFKIKFYDVKKHFKKPMNLMLSYLGFTGLAGTLLMKILFQIDF